MTADLHRVLPASRRYELEPAWYLCRTDESSRYARGSKMSQGQSSLPRSNVPSFPGSPTGNSRGGLRAGCRASSFLNRNQKS